MSKRGGARFFGRSSLWDGADRVVTVPGMCGNGRGVRSFGRSLDIRYPEKKAVL